MQQTCQRHHRFFRMPHPRHLTPIIVLTAFIGIASPQAASAQAETYATEPTLGVESERLTLSGQFDAQAATQNPGGLALLRGGNTVLTYEGAAESQATAAGWGAGLFVASAPRRFWAGSAVATGLEFIRPTAGRVTPSVGTPLRLTNALAVPLGATAGLGVAWHHYCDRGPLGGLDTFTLGLAARLGRHVSFGAVLRDANAPIVQGAEVQRRYELEATMRPWRDARMEVRLGGRVGEVRGDVGAWAGAAVRVAPGVTLNATALTRQAFVIDGEGGERKTRDVEGWLGLSIAAGKTVMSTWGGLGRRGQANGFRGAGGSIAIFASPRASQVRHPPRLERVVLRGAMTDRTLRETVDRLTWLARQDNVKVVTLAIDDLAAGWATMRELRLAVAQLAATKQVYAYLVGAGMREYYVASAASKVYVDPAGGLRLLGVASASVFVRDFIEQLGGQAEFEKIAEYKSAPEMFTEMGPTPAAQAMRDELVGELFDVLVKDVARSRRLSEEAARDALVGGPYAPVSEKLAPLIDGVATPAELSEIISKGHPGVRVGRNQPPEPETWSSPVIGLVYIDGDIVDGASRETPLIGRRAVGSKTVVAALSELAANRRVQAVVIRINTPGGSALASELISRKISEVAAHKPVFCSLGDVAASGGYFAAAACSRVFASPNTITGSIGIFAGKFNFASGLARLGIAVHVSKRGDRADMDGFARARTEEEQALVREQLRYYYGRFVDTVAKGRGLTTAQVDATGRGLVISGRRALAVGLVDELGTFADAIAAARAQAGIAEADEVQLISLPRRQRGLLQLVSRFITAQASLEPSSTSQLPPYVREALEAIPTSLLLEPGTVQARLPFVLMWP
ncbi:MAG: signal peptide peptidase SppA [Myxococcales bacterium]|nr:signal peptide peptidase SppA [Myxococcales bacterium]